MTSDHVRIEGWLIRCRNPEGVLILSHGFGTGKADLLDVAKAFYSQGPYHLLLIDFRGHGSSGGNRLSFGAREILDIQSVLDFLSTDPEMRDLPIGYYGVSMGGAIGLIAAAHLSRICAVVSDSAYDALGDAIARAVRMSYYVPRIPLGQVIIWCSELRMGCRAQNLSPIQVIGRISPRSVMLVHGMNDKTAPPGAALSLFRACGEPKRLWLVPEAEHVASFYRNTQEYVHQVMEFFRGALRGTP